MPSRALILGASLGVVLLATIAISFSTPNTPVVTSEQPVLHIEPVAETGISADAFVVFDLETGKSLVTHNEDKERPIASVTKLFSAATVLQQAPLQATTSVTWNDVATEGRSGKLEPYVEYSYRDLLWPLLLESSNDAAATLERVEPDLVAKMNEFAQEQLASHTFFSDASGLSENNRSTAEELALLTRHLYISSPHLFDITQLPQYIGTQTGWVNNNPFIDIPEYRGGKHGFTYEANRTGVMFFEENLSSGGTRLLGYVLLGSDNLADDVNILRERIKAATTIQ